MAFAASNINEPNLGATLAAKVNRVVLNYTIPTPANDTYTLALYIPVGVQLTNIYYKTDSGTCTLNVRLDASSIGGWSALSASSTEGNAAASGSNTASVGQTLDVVISSVVSADMLAITIVGAET